LAAPAGRSCELGGVDLERIADHARNRRGPTAGPLPVRAGRLRERRVHPHVPAASPPCDRRPSAVPRAQGVSWNAPDEKNLRLPVTRASRLSGAALADAHRLDAVLAHGLDADRVAVG